MSHAKVLSNSPNLDHVVLYPPAMAEMASSIAAALSTTAVHCTDELSSPSKGGADLALAWEIFDSANPNVKLRADALIGKHVVLLINQDVTRAPSSLS